MSWWLMISGRALDTAPPALYTLLEIRKNCPEILEKCEVSPNPLVLQHLPLLSIPISPYHFVLGYHCPYTLA